MGGGGGVCRDRPGKWENSFQKKFEGQNGVDSDMSREQR